MAIRTSKEKTLFHSGTLEEARHKAKAALTKGGFKKISINEELNCASASFNNFFVVGKIDISITPKDQGVEIQVKSTANSDNIFALFSSPNEKILNSFVSNY
jgi:hypothetical protein